MADRGKFGHPGIGSSATGGEVPMRIFRVIGGNEVVPGVLGIKKIEEEYDFSGFDANLISGGPSATPPILPDGLGCIQNYQSGKFVWAVNDPRSTCLSDMLAGQRVYASENISVSGNQFYFITGI